MTVAFHSPYGGVVHVVPSRVEEYLARHGYRPVDASAVEAAKSAPKPEPQPDNYRGKDAEPQPAKEATADAVRDTPKRRRSPRKAAD